MIFPVIYLSTLKISFQLKNQRKFWVLFWQIGGFPLWYKLIFIPMI